ncbi:hypothetical protein HPE56_18985 [Maribacter sp. ANRC-HE7]|uniref:Carbohydrate-binding domain-containing protein n=1 Tax=Maribacter aquimaris TaxID=2737171 RepID=A0ABR7V523_9FLAO|nr:carbohydrate-binding family 9-like protein [Maribacter aquimaris]MBD0779888.1 hypothetical protein [Maribacter aquimaris]
MEAAKSLVIPFIPDLDEIPLEQLNETLASSGFSSKIDQINWEAYRYKPSVDFYLAHNNQHLFILYKVIEENIHAKHVNDNDAVWEDSCVEAFFSKNSNEGYFNFEVSCIGTVLVGFGMGRDNRIHLEDDRMKTIKRASSLGKEIIGKDNVNGSWWLQLAIPLEILGVKKGQTIRANFYKCGDECKVPHFLSWQPILTPQPDFHQPDFFADLILE